MECFATLPMWNYSRKQIEITDSDKAKVGYVQRQYKGFWNKVMHYSPITLSFLETINIDGRSGGTYIKIRERSFKSNLTKLKWDVFLDDEITEHEFLLEDQTKVSTNPRFVYHKGDTKYAFKIDLFNRTCEINSNSKLCATVRLDKRVPPSLQATTKTDGLAVVELIGIYYVINLTY